MDHDPQAPPARSCSSIPTVRPRTLRDNFDAAFHLSQAKQSATEQARVDTAQESLHRYKAERCPPWRVGALSASRVPSKISLHKRALVQRTIRSRQSPPTSDNEVSVAKRARRSIDNDKSAEPMDGQSPETAKTRSPPDNHHYMETNLPSLSSLDSSKDGLLEQMIWCFNCCYVSTSYLSESADFAAQLGYLNAFLLRLHRVAGRLQAMTGAKPSTTHMRPSPLPWLRPASALHALLTRETASQSNGMYKDIYQSMAQMTAVLLLAMLFVDLHAESGMVFEYKIQLESMVRESEVDSSRAIFNLIWLMSQVRGLKADDRNRRWRVAGCLHVVRYLPAEKEAELKSWILEFLEGRTPAQGLRYTMFDFSYAG